ncbi:hypothetical protein FJ250_04565 [bacterium]|nr:hypothetical protein [bacterium]
MTERQDGKDRRDRRLLTHYDVLLGLVVLAVAAAGLPWLGQQLNEAKSARSRDHAERVAQAILDFHTESGQWPAPVGQPVALAIRTAPPPPGHRARAMALADSEAVRPWVDNLPVDSWGRPFVAAVYGGGPAPDPAVVPAPARDSLAYPMAPPAGTTIVVVSAGRDGILQSDLDALARAAGATFSGDDIGQVLQGRGAGG